MLENLGHSFRQKMLEFYTLSSPFVPNRDARNRKEKTGSVMDLGRKLINGDARDAAKNKAWQGVRSGAMP